MPKANLIYGPPGTGKTTEGVKKVLSWVNEGLDPTRIALMSYTRKGAYEIRDRVREKLGMTKELLLPYVGTIHSIVFKAGGYNRADIISRREIIEFGSLIGMNFTYQGTSNDDAYITFIDLYRNNPKAADVWLENINYKMVEWIFKEYKLFKEARRKVDFTDLLEWYMAEGYPLDIDKGILDEAQDTASLHWKVFWKATSLANEVYIYGDDDQAIFGWAGADTEYYTSIKGSVQVLEFSHRLPKPIFDYSQKVLSAIYERVEKVFKPTDREGSISMVTAFEELDFTKGQWLILARTNSILAKAAAFLKEQGIIYKNKDSTSLDPDVLTAINAYEKQQQGQLLTGEERTIFESFKVQDGDMSLPWEQYFKDLPDKEYYAKLLEDNPTLQESDVQISTIHGAKGGEADNVVLMLDIGKRVNGELINGNSDAEMRVYYVGVTRARVNLYLLAPETNKHYPILLED